MLDRDQFLPQLRNHDPRRNDAYYLPPMGGGGNVRFFLATLTTNWSGTAPNITASADLYTMADVSLSTNVTVRDPLGTFAALTSGDRLEIKRQDGVYYSNQAPCPTP